MGDAVVVEDLSELAGLVGRPLGPTGWIQIDQDRIDAFADATGDQQWIHVDVERASRESRFGGTIAHGYLTLSLAPVLLPQLLDVRGASSVVNSGLDRMRLPAPVPAGARVRLKAELRQVRELPGGGGVRAVIGLHFEVEGARKPACTADAVYVYFA